MLGSSNVTPVVATKDLDRAKEFYQSVLGLEIAHEEPYAILFKTGNGLLQVYPSEYAGTNQATVVTWEVADIQQAVADLKGKGVTFEHYDMPGITLDGDVHRMEGEDASWFKDPDGNILCLHQEHQLAA